MVDILGSVTDPAFEAKAKYLRRTGSSGNYRYFYAQQHRAGEMNRPLPATEHVVPGKFTEKNNAMSEENKRQYEAIARLDRRRDPEDEPVDSAIRAEIAADRWRDDAKKEGLTGDRLDLYMDTRRDGYGHSDALDAVQEAYSSSSEEMNDADRSIIEDYLSEMVLDGNYQSFGEFKRAIDRDGKIQKYWSTESVIDIAKRAYDQRPKMTEGKADGTISTVSARRNR